MVADESASAPDPVPRHLANLLARIPATGALRSLRSPSYFILWTTNLATHTGFWVSNVSLQWLVARLTGNDALMLGILYFMNLVPIFLFAPYAGVLADRHQRKLIVSLGQASAGVFAAGLVVMLALVGDGLHAALIFPFAFGIGTALALNAPASQAITVNSVPPADVPSAIALQSVALNLSRVAGPALATPILLAWGGPGAFAVFALTSWFTASVVLRVRVRAVPPLDGNTPALRRIAEGLRTARARPPTLLALLTVAAGAIFSSSYVSMLPVYAYDVLGGDDSTFTTLIIITGVGAIVGALSTNWTRGLPSLRGIGIVMLLMSVALIGFANSTRFALSLVFTAVVAGLNFSMMTNLNTTLQYLTPEQSRGRIMSLYIVAWGGLLPFGALGLGALARAAGPAPAVTSFAAVAGLFALALVLKGPRVAPAPGRA